MQPVQYWTNFDQIASNQYYQFYNFLLDCHKHMYGLHNWDQRLCCDNKWLDNKVHLINDVCVCVCDYKSVFKIDSKNIDTKRTNYGCKLA